MVIKKYNKQLNEKNNQTRLEAYARQGRSYRKTHKGSFTQSNALLKSSLAAVIPLAAAGALQAQCLGPLNDGNTITIPITYIRYGGTFSSGRYPFDVDGDGINDFDLVRQKFPSPLGGGDSNSFEIEPLGTMSLRQNGQFSPLLNVTGTVTRAQSFFNDDFNVLYNMGPFGGSGPFPEGQIGFVGIRKGDSSTGQPGWIKIEVVDVIAGQIKVYERGLESTSNNPINSAVVDDCASMAVTLPVEMTHFRTTSNAKVGWVGGHGTTHEAKEYRFIDNEVKANTRYYYRLQQMDTDGTTDFSPVRSAMVADASLVQVSEFFPNPVGKERAAARFELNMPTAGEVYIEVFDVRGALVQSLSRAYTEGWNTLRVPVRDLATGQYFVKLQLGQEGVYRKLSVK